MRSFWLLLAACVLCGCDAINDLPAATPKPVELPIVNVPRAEREWNWGGGSCVHASTVMHLRWQNAMELADYWRKTYSGGESYNGLTSKLNRNHVPFYATAGGGGQDIARAEALDFTRFISSRGGSYGTLAGDVDVLERCTQERRGGVIFYYPNHSILFCGFGPSATKPNSGEVAYVLDNNRIESFIEIPKAEFIRKWRGWGGVCVVPTIQSPRPPIPYIAAR